MLKETTSNQRMGEYLQSLFSDKHSAYEIKIFRAKDHVLDIWQEVMKRIFDRYMRITNQALSQGLLNLGYPPSINDLNSNFINNYGLGIVVCHDGKIFKYASNQEIKVDYYKMIVEKYLKKAIMNMRHRQRRLRN